MSQANYIIICRGRTRALAANDPFEQLLIAADCAASVVDNLSIRFPELSYRDIKPISDLLHDVMGGLAASIPAPMRAAFFGGADEVPAERSALKKDEMFQKTCDLFARCDELANKFEGGEYVPH